MKARKPAQIGLHEIRTATDWDERSKALRRRGAEVVDAVGAALHRLGTWGDVAQTLDRIYGPAGRPVSESVLSAAFSDKAERNYPRLEWIVLVDRDPEVSALLCPPKLTPEEELRITNEHLASEAPGVWRSLQKRLGRSAP